jgi:hypothetical protein
MESGTPLDVFGALVTESLRDSALRRAEALLKGSLKSPDVQSLQAALQELTLHQREIVRFLVRNSVDAGIHDFLFKLQESAGSLAMSVDGQDVASLSDGLHGEAYSERGWYARFSQFPID